MLKNIPAEVVEYVRSIMEDYEYSDNMRIYRDGDYESLKEYEEARMHGCCGYVDYQPFRWNGIQYFYGFNYGH